MIANPFSLRRRKRAYQSLFEVRDGAIVGAGRTVLADLARFCRATTPPLVKIPTGMADPLQTGVMIGRQEVFNRIRAMVLIDDRRLFNLEEEQEMTPDATELVAPAQDTTVSMAADFLTTGQTPPSGPAPAAPASAAPAATAAAPTLDLDALEDEELKAWVRNKAFPDLQTAMESQRKLEKLLGADKLPLPRDEQDAEGWERVAKALGRPDAPEDYGLTAAPGVDPDFAGEAGRWFHAAGLNKRQAEGLAAAYGAFAAQAREREMADFRATAAAELAAVQGEWGALADQRAEEARRGLRLLGWDSEMAGRFEQGVGTRRMLDALSRIGGAIGEDNLVLGDRPRGFGLTPAAAQARIRSLSADKAWTARYLSGDADAKAEMERLNRVVAQGA